MDHLKSCHPDLNALHTAFAGFLVFPGAIHVGNYSANVFGRKDKGREGEDLQAVLLGQFVSSYLYLTASWQSHWKKRGNIEAQLNMYWWAFFSNFTSILFEELAWCFPCHITLRNKYIVGVSPFWCNNNHLHVIVDGTTLRKASTTYIATTPLLCAKKRGRSRKVDRFIISWQMNFRGHNINYQYPNLSNRPI